MRLPRCGGTAFRRLPPLPGGASAAASAHRLPLLPAPVVLPARTQRSQPCLLGGAHTGGAYGAACCRALNLAHPGERAVSAGGLLLGPGVRPSLSGSDMASSSDASPSSSWLDVSTMLGRAAAWRCGRSALLATAPLHAHNILSARDAGLRPAALCQTPGGPPLLQHLSACIGGCKGRGRARALRERLHGVLGRC